jgi:hypothetical protein
MLERTEQLIRALGLKPGAVVAYLHGEVLTLAPSADLDAWACGVQSELECHPSEGLPLAGYAGRWLERPARLI